jgi:CheY-like chemotaxis protein
MMENGPVQGRTVLLIEDDPDIREAIGDVLSEEGYTVAMADTGQQGLHCLRGADPLPDVILLDLMMPVMDGWMFRQEQKREPAWDAIPVIVLSAAGNARERAESIGAAGCLRKPLDIDELLALLARVVAESDVRQG